jgi:cell division protein FtsB
MSRSAKPPRNPRPLAAFFLSLTGSAIVLGLVLLYDGRVVELKKAKAEIHQLDEQIAAKKQENAKLRAAIASANRGELPAEKVAREELHLVNPDDIVLLYPPGTLSPGQASPAPPTPGAPPPDRGAPATAPPTTPAIPSR